MGYSSRWGHGNSRLTRAPLRRVLRDEPRNGNYRVAILECGHDVPVYEFTSQPKRRRCAQCEQVQAAAIGKMETWALLKCRAAGRFPGGPGPRERLATLGEAQLEQRAQHMQVPDRVYQQLVQAGLITPVPHRLTAAGRVALSRALPE